MQGIIEQIGLILEIAGVAIILISQAIFVRRSHKKWGGDWRDYKKEFISASYAHWARSDEDIKAISDDERDKVLKESPLGGLLDDDFKYTIGGLGITLIGLAIQFWSFFL